jgi:AcrR family transcriptional regulator
MSRTASKRTGRRPGATDSREQIANAARSAFAELGYERASFRRIATAAGVDPALVVHFFGSKAELFRQVMALPAEIAVALAKLADGPRETVGRRLAEVVVGALENPVSRTITLGRIRCAATHPDAAALVRETVTRDLRTLAEAVTDDRPDRRAVLIGADIVGIALARYVVLVEPLASMSPSEVIEIIAPTFQHYLVEPLIPRASPPL